MKEMDTYLSENRTRFESELFDLLRIPSISTDSKYKDDVRNAATWMQQQFQKQDFASEIIETDRHPIVYAESPAVPGKPTVLVYGHYDVQPPDPLDKWESPPFEPTVRLGNVYARGATDDKGQMFTHVKSAEACQAVSGELPLQIKFLIEGEEEIGSPNLDKFLQADEAVEKLACDVVVISDSGQFAKGIPAITYGLRGITYFELFLQGPKVDLHSGTFGAAVANPANMLCQLMASLFDDDGRVQLPGFYDDVIPLTDRERDQFRSLPFSDEEFMEQIGTSALFGEKGYSTLERRWARPSYDINGLTSGYQDEGAKTVLPAEASAKFSFRLVPNQDPQKIVASLRQYLKDHCPPGIEYRLQEMHHAPGFVISLDSPYMSAASKAIELGFGTPPVFIREGGSIPVVTTFSERLGVDTLLLGWGLNDDNTHSPNEKFNLEDFHRGIKSSAYLWQVLSEIEA